MYDQNLLSDIWVVFSYEFCLNSRNVSEDVGAISTKYAPKTSKKFATCVELVDGVFLRHSIVRFGRLVGSEITVFRERVHACVLPTPAPTDISQWKLHVGYPQRSPQVPTSSVGVLPPIVPTPSAHPLLCPQFCQWIRFA